MPAKQQIVMLQSLIVVVANVSLTYWNIVILYDPTLTVIFWTAVMDKHTQYLQSFIHLVKAINLQTWIFFLILWVHFHNQMWNEMIGTSGHNSAVRLHWDNLGQWDEFCDAIKCESSLTNCNQPFTWIEKWPINSVLYNTDALWSPVLTYHRSYGLGEGQISTLFTSVKVESSHTDFLLLFFLAFVYSFIGWCGDRYGDGFLRVCRANGVGRLVLQFQDGGGWKHTKCL